MRTYTINKMGLINKEPVILSNIDTICISCFIKTIDALNDEIKLIEENPVVDEEEEDNLFAGIYCRIYDYIYKTFTNYPDLYEEAKENEDFINTIIINAQKYFKTLSDNETFVTNKEIREKLVTNIQLVMNLLDIQPE